MIMVVLMIKMMMMMMMMMMTVTVIVSRLSRCLTIARGKRGTALSLMHLREFVFLTLEALRGGGGERSN